MTHAERCPVCLGKGRLSTPQDISTTIERSTPCHGCNGLGWVEVKDQTDTWYGPSYYIPTNEGSG